MDVEFSVVVRRGKRSFWPRGENGDHVFTVGNARPLDQALQHATTEMLRWLQEDFGLDALGANTLLGQCVEYDVGTSSILRTPWSVSSQSTYSRPLLAFPEPRGSLTLGSLGEPRFEPVEPVEPRTYLV